MSSLPLLVYIITVKSLFSATALIYFNRCRTTGAKKEDGAKKRKALNFSMAIHGLEKVEKDERHLSKD